MPTVTIKRSNDGYGFEARDEAGLSIRMDNSASGGGTGFGVSPMQSLLMALGGCSGIDIVSILKKQRQDLQELTIEVKGEREKDVIPALWTAVHMRFVMKGRIDQDKAEYAAKLSVDKYCSVAETLRRSGCMISWNVELL